MNTYKLLHLLYANNLSRINSAQDWPHVWVGLIVIIICLQLQTKTNYQHSKTKYQELRESRWLKVGRNQVKDFGWHLEIYHLEMAS